MGLYDVLKNNDPRVGGGSVGGGSSVSRSNSTLPSAQRFYRTQNAALSLPNSAGVRPSTQRNYNPQGGSYVTGSQSYTKYKPVSTARPWDNPNYGWIQGQYQSALAAADAGLGSALTSMAGNNLQRDNSNRYANAQYDNSMAGAKLDAAGYGVDAEALARQKGYIEDLFGIQSGQRLLDAFSTAIDMNANQRQYALINMERGNAKEDWSRYQDMFARQLQGNTEQEAAQKRNEASDQQKLIAKAAAQGNVGAINALDSRDLHATMNDALNELSRNRQQFYADREAAKQAYNTAMVNLNEREAQTTDQAEKYKIQQEKARMQQQEAERVKRENLAKLEDEKRQNAIKLMQVELAKRNAEALRNYQLGQSNAASIQDIYNWGNAVNKANADKAAAAAAENAARQKYGIPANPTRASLREQRLEARLLKR